MSEIKFLPNFKPELQDAIEQSLVSWEVELRQLLPTLTQDLTVDFDNNYLIPDFGTGGSAWDATTLKLAYDPSFNASQADLLAELKATYFHEGYHLARDFSFVTTLTDMPAINLAIEEGAATKFEVLRANSNPGYAKYEDRATMLNWIDEVKALPNGFN